MEIYLVYLLYFPASDFSWSPLEDSVNDLSGAEGPFCTFLPVHRLELAKFEVYENRWRYQVGADSAVKNAECDVAPKKGNILLTK